MIKMANTSMDPTIGVTVRWNALEKSILESIGYERDQLFGDCWYSLEDMRELDFTVAQTQNPERPDITVADRFERPDHVGKVPIDQLSNEIETILSNMERQKAIVDQFDYDPDSKL